MRKLKIGLILCCAAATMVLSGCNRAFFDGNYTFDKAIIQRGGKEQIVEIKSWRDYEGEQIQLELTDDSIILVSSYNCILVHTNGGKSEVL